VNEYGMYVEKNEVSGAQQCGAVGQCPVSTIFFSFFGGFRVEIYVVWLWSDVIE